MKTRRGSPALPPLQLLRLLLLLLPLPGASTGPYKPVIIVHGLFDAPKQFMKLTEIIQKEHPGTLVVPISLYDNYASLTPMWKQVQGFGSKINSIMNMYPDGVHLLCFSQGGLVCRAVLSTMPHHNVHTFISLSSPQAGQYGDTDAKYLWWIFHGCLKKEVYHICYHKLGKKVSICDYWNDPHHRPDYLKNNDFLALLNGDKPHSNMTAWRDNFLRIKKLVLIGGPDDGVITPWQSSHFGFYDSNEEVVEMRNQTFYRKDTFGLKTLDARGDVSVCVQPGVKHTSWHSNFTVFRTCMEKWLT